MYMYIYIGTYIYIYTILSYIYIYMNATFLKYNIMYNNNVARDPRCAPPRDPYGYSAGGGLRPISLLTLWISEGWTRA